VAEVSALVRSVGLAGLVRPASAHARDPAAGDERILPVPAGLRPVLPDGGLRRGATIAVGPGTGATSVLLSLLGTASAGGAWTAVVGMPALNPAAAAELGACLDRLALVPYPGPEWTAVVAALLDGFDLVVAAPPGPVAAAVAARLAARARQRGGVLVGFGSWPGAELVLRPDGGTWAGLGHGRGRLVRRELRVLAQGRGAAARPRRTRLVLPDPGTGPVPARPVPLRLAGVPAPAAAPGADRPDPRIPAGLAEAVGAW